jgi:ketosteroid isomerase-like protein
VSSSQENVEIVRRLFEAWRQKDTPTALELDPEAEFKSALVDLGQKVYRGRAEIEQYRADLEAVWETWETKDERCLPVGNDCVVSLYRVSGKGKGSGTPVEQDVSIVFRIRRGKVTNLTAYLDQREALTAAGLSEKHESEATTSSPTRIQAHPPTAPGVAQLPSV